MSASNFNLRGMPQEVMLFLKKEAKNQQISINSLILNIIEQGIGYTPQKKKKIYHELDELAGTWTAQESKAFKEKNKTFENIDPELWK